mgnify:CR=1 FL=1
MRKGGESVDHAGNRHGHPGDWIGMAKQTGRSAEDSADALRIPAQRPFDAFLAQDGIMETEGRLIICRI